MIIYLHGGGFRFGSASQYGPEPLIGKNVILVPVQYRLGSLGLLGAGTREFPGNLAFFDCLTAIEWVFEYISFFGGDPFNIKVMGHGSGASMAMFMGQTSLSRNLIRGVISMSGSILSRNSIDDHPVLSVGEVSDANRCPQSSYTETIQCLRKVC